VRCRYVAVADAATTGPDKARFQLADHLPGIAGPSPTHCRRCSDWMPSTHPSSLSTRNPPRSEVLDPGGRLGDC